MHGPTAILRADLTALPPQDYDKEKLVSNGHVVAWRAAHWANWHFEIAGYEYEQGGNASITFGKGGFQGARGGLRARSQCRFAPPLIRFTPDSLREPVPLFF
jgi:hypothetical protein